MTNDTTVLFTTNPQKASVIAKNQAFFEGFNWPQFEVGDIVWLEDYKANDVARKISVGIICRFDFGNPVIRLLNTSTSRWLGHRDYVSIFDIEDRKIRKHFENYMYH